MKLPPNQALKLTLRAACLLGGPAFGEARGMRWSCTSPAVQLYAGVGCPPYRQVPIR